MGILEFYKRGGTLLLFAALLILAACSSDSIEEGNNETGKQSGSESLDKVTVLLDWAWWPGHVPFIVAQEKGFYEDVGLEVELQQGQGSGTTAVAVGQGTHDLGHINQMSTARSISEGVPITAIATLQQKGATSLVGFEEMNLKNPEDVKGLRIGSTPSGSDAQLLPAFLSASGISLDEVEVVNMQGDAKIGALFNNTVDVISGDIYYYEGALAERERNSSSILFGDYGANSIGFGFIANNKYLEKEPEKVRLFLEATYKAYEYTYDNLDESIDLFIDKVDLADSHEFIKQNLISLRELYYSDNTKDKQLGWNSEENWKETLDLLEEFGGMKEQKQIDKYFTNEYLPEDKNYLSQE